MIDFRNTVCFEVDQQLGSRNGALRTTNTVLRAI